jgi:hypothetical protein
MKLEITSEGTITQCILEKGTLHLSIPERIDDIEVKSLGAEMCQQMMDLLSVVLPKTLESIEEHAFYYCSHLQSLAFPESLVSIGHGAFGCCGAIKALVFPEKLTSIGPLAFHTCSHLESVVFSKGLTSIGYLAFVECGALQSIEIPTSVTTIGENAFSECPRLQSIFVENPSEVERVRGLLPLALQGFVRVNPKNNRWSPLRSAWIGAMIFGGRVDPRRAAIADAGAGAPAGGGGSGAA